MGLFYIHPFDFVLVMKMAQANSDIEGNLPKFEIISWDQ